MSVKEKSSKFFLLRNKYKVTWSFYPGICLDDGALKLLFMYQTTLKCDRHVNSEGWEKYWTPCNLYCHKKYFCLEDLYLDFSDLYKKLKHSSGFTTEELDIFFEENGIVCDDAEEGEEEMIDCY